MGIHGYVGHCCQQTWLRNRLSVFKEIGRVERVALSKYSLQKFLQFGRPFRLAIDISIWLFQLKSSKGGEQPALRTFYYRLLRLTAHAIQPLFVFDGPQKPKIKRNKNTGPNLATIPEFLAKQLLQQFGLPYHNAPGEAEAECALLQKEGIVDAVLSEDVDTIMFGSRVTLRNWSALATGQVPTHVDVYDSAQIKSGPSRLDPPAMILIALMSGGDYNTEGIPGCGPKIACEAARAGFGRQLCDIPHGDLDALLLWKQRLVYELRTNESGYFKTKHGSLLVPDSFPDPQILQLYTNPAISSLSALQPLRIQLMQEKPIDLPELRKFTQEAFKWHYLIGAKKFIRTLAPALLVRQLRLASDNSQAHLVQKIYQARAHPSTDNTPELRISFIPNHVVDIDLTLELPDPTSQANAQETPPDDLDEPPDHDPASTSSRPYLFEPDQPTKIWIPEHFIKTCATKTYAAWTQLNQQKSLKSAKRPARSTAKNPPATTQQAQIYNYTRVTKLSATSATHSRTNSCKDLLPHQASVTKQNQPTTTQPTPIVDLLSSSPPHIQQSLPRPATESVASFSNNTTTVRRRTPLHRNKALTDSFTYSSTKLSHGEQYSTWALETFQTASSIPILDLTFKRKAGQDSPIATPKANKKPVKATVELPLVKPTIAHYFSPSNESRQIQSLDLTMSPQLCLARSGLFRNPALVYPINKPAQKDRSMGNPSITCQYSFPNTIDLTACSPPPSPTTSTRKVSLASSYGLTIATAARTVAESQSSSDDITIAAKPREISHPAVLLSKKSATTAPGRAGDGAPSTLVPDRPRSYMNSSKQRIRLRESLQGAFAIEEEGDTTTSARKPAKTWLMSEINVLDLTDN